MYLDESHGNSARERARSRVHIHARRVCERTYAHPCTSYTCTVRVRVYVRASITYVCSRSLSDTGAIFLSVPWDKARGGEITREDERSKYTRGTLTRLGGGGVRGQEGGTRSCGRDGWNARGKNRDVERADRRQREREGERKRDRR